MPHRLCTTSIRSDTVVHAACMQQTSYCNKNEHHDCKRSTSARLKDVGSSCRRAHADLWWQLRIRAIWQWCSRSGLDSLSAVLAESLQVACRVAAENSRLQVICYLIATWPGRPSCAHLNSLHGIHGPCLIVLAKARNRHCQVFTNDQERLERVLAPAFILMCLTHWAIRMGNEAGH